MTGNGFMRNIMLYLSSQKYGFKEFFFYRAQAISWAIVQGLGSVGTLVFVSVVYSVSSGLPGWSYYQLLALGGISQLTGGLLAASVNPRNLVRIMRNGGLDQFLIKPYNPILVIIARNPVIRNVGSVIGGLLLLIYALYGAGVTISGVLLFIPTYAAGLAALVMAVLVLALLSYVKFKDAGYTSWLMNIMMSAADYPVTIYGIIGSMTLSVLLPITFAIFLPAAAIFGYVSYVVVLETIAVSVALATMFYYSSHYLLKKYESGGG